MRFSHRQLLATLAVLEARQAHAAKNYEVWASDQSNTVAGQDALGVRGSLLWVWTSDELESVVEGNSATPSSLPCSPDAEAGPCDLFTIFPGTLTESGSGEALAEAAGFGRWHGTTKDPQNKYVTANIFSPNGGYLGIIDTETRGAVGLFRVTEMSYVKSITDDAPTTTRNVHMSFWNDDGSAILVHNLAGKALERINVERDPTTGKITALSFDKSATLGFGKDMLVSKEAVFFSGNNAFGIPLLGEVTGSYDNADLGNLTPNGDCKESGCTSLEANPVGRPNNVPICAVMSSDGLAFNTMGGGGLLVADTTSTPMTIVGAYGNGVIAGAGVCGEQVQDYVYVTSGTSASSAGATQSLFMVYGLDPKQYSSSYVENQPSPIVVIDDATNTASGGRDVGPATNDSGQIPGITTRRDAHDLTGTIDGKYVHVIDRIQNIVEVFDSGMNEAVGSYDLTTATGMDQGEDGPCAAASVTDGGADFPINDPAPDFIDASPDGKYMMLSFRGPAPVSASHAAQGSCPGVGIVELLENGKSGRLVAVLRTTNTMNADNLESVSPPGGATYVGTERSDIHDTVVIFKDDNDANGDEVVQDDEKEGASAASGSLRGYSTMAFMIAFLLVML